MVGEIPKTLQWLYVQYISCQQNQVKYISKLYCEMFVFYIYTPAVLIRYSAIATTEDSKTFLVKYLNLYLYSTLAKIVCNIG